MLSRMAVVEVPTDEFVPPIRIPTAIEASPPLVTMDRASVGYEAGKPILTGLSLRIDPEDRIALLGKNGNGKSTFAKLLAGKLEAMGGEFVRARKLVVGYFAQHQQEELDTTITPVETPHHSAIPGHLGLISMLVGRKIKWDPVKEEIIGDPEASKLLSRPYRNPWKMVS